MTPKETLRATAAGAPVERSLVAPLLGGALGHMEGLTPRAFLSNPTKLANRLRDLQRGLNLDVLWAEAASLVDVEALGQPLDWTSYPPRPSGTFRAPATPLPLALGTTRLGAVMDVIRRLAPMIGGRAAVGVCLFGPARLVRLTGGALSAEAAAAGLLAVVRLVCEAGADLVMLADESSALTLEHAEALEPVWATILFHQAVPALALTGGPPATGLLQTLPTRVIPCLEPQSASDLVQRGEGPFGLLVSAEALGGHDLSAAIRTRRCLLLTTVVDLASQVTLNDLPSAVERIRNAGAVEYEQG